MSRTRRIPFLHFRTSRSRPAIMRHDPGLHEGPVCGINWKWSGAADRSFASSAEAGRGLDSAGAEKLSRWPRFGCSCPRGSSLTAREGVSCLGPAGYHIEVLDPDPLCLARWSRWVRKVHRCPRPGGEPLDWLELVKHLVVERRIDVVLPTHEQAGLFAPAAARRAGGAGAVSDIAAFGRVQSKVEFARLLDEFGLPQPPWRPVASEDDLVGLPFPYLLKGA